MDEQHRTQEPLATARSAVRAALVASVTAVAALTLLPVGAGWDWGSPMTELRWYATGLGSEATVLQLLGNVVLLVVPVSLAVLLRPSLGRIPRLAALSLAGGTAIELLQWALPLGRVVSPLDAVLNATGAVAAGVLVARAARRRAPASAPYPLRPDRPSVAVPCEPSPFSPASTTSTKSSPCRVIPSTTACSMASVA
jgi:hypothetical protein